MTNPTTRTRAPKYDFVATALGYGTAQKYPNACTHTVEIQEDGTVVVKSTTTSFPVVGVYQNENSFRAAVSQSIKKNEMEHVPHTRYIKRSTENPNVMVMRLVRAKQEQPASLVKG